jgi:hypothetical protein
VVLDVAGALAQKDTVLAVFGIKEEHHPGGGERGVNDWLLGIRGQDAPDQVRRRNNHLGELTAFQTTGYGGIHRFHRF